MIRQLTRAAAAALAAATLLLCRPGAAEAHPLLIGQWAAEAPPGNVVIYDFGPADYVYNGVWRGRYTLSVSGRVTVDGCYELRQFSGTEATIGLKDGVGIATAVGNIDFAARTMNFRGVIYRR
jgi:hypothetical protein